MLSRADPYSALMLTAAEMPQFPAELDTELGQTPAKVGHELLLAIRAPAERGATGTSL
jgi:hypothetical protein